MNKYLTLFCFGAIALGATSHAMDPLRPGSLQQGSPRQGSGSVSAKATSDRQAGQAEQVTALGLSLRNAASNGNIKQVETLLKQGAPIDAKDNDGYTPLMIAAYKGHEQICKLLIDNKAAIDTKENDGRTPLMYAARNGHEQTCKLLIENKATIDAKDNRGNTPLKIAARVCHEQICKLLIENKATIDAKDNNGNTPLMMAAQFGHEQICKLLIDALLVPVKEKQAVAISLLGIKKYRNIPGFHYIDREVIRLIVRPAYECSKRQLFDQINAIQDQDMKQRLVDYAKQQLRAQNLEASHE